MYDFELYSEVFCKLHLWDGLLFKVSLIAFGHISRMKSFWVHAQCSEFLGLIFLVEMLIESCVRQTQQDSLQFNVKALLKTHVNVPQKQGKRNANISLPFSGISTSRAKFSCEENGHFLVLVWLRTYCVIFWHFKLKSD